MSNDHGLAIGLVDQYQFSRECVIGALANLNPDNTLFPYQSVTECTVELRQDFDLIIYHLHAADLIKEAAVQDVAAIHQAFPSVPLIVLSDAEATEEPIVSRQMLENGAHTFMLTRATGIFNVSRAIRLLKLEDTCAPVQQKPLRAAAYSAPIAPALHHQQLTAREVAVLGHLQRGSANKIIAHELQMSENTVKVHVRNIIRKMEATNRTQAVYKARGLWQVAT